MEIKEKTRERMELRIHAQETSGRGQMRICVPERKFKVGDKVRWCRLVGRVKQVYPVFCYGVKFPGHQYDEGFDDCFFNEDELVLAEEGIDAKSKDSSTKGSHRLDSSSKAI